MANYQLSFSRLVSSDYLFYKNYSKLNDPFGVMEKKVNFFKIIKLFIFSKSFRFIFFLRLAQSTYGLILIGNLLEYVINHIYNCDVDIRCKLGPCLYFPHPFGIVLGGSAILKGFSIIFNDVTVGKKYPGLAGGMPSIGYRNILCVGSRVLGEIKLGNRVIIAANSVVTKSISNGKTVVDQNKIIHKTYV